MSKNISRRFLIKSIGGGLAGAAVGTATNTVWSALSGDNETNKSYTKPVAVGTMAGASAVVLNDLCQRIGKKIQSFQTGEFYLEDLSKLRKLPKEEPKPEA